MLKKTSGEEEEERKKEDENCFKSRLKCDKRLRRLKMLPVHGFPNHTIVNWEENRKL